LDIEPHAVVGRRDREATVDERGRHAILTASMASLAGDEAVEENRSRPNLAYSADDEAGEEDADEIRCSGSILLASTTNSIAAQGANPRGRFV